MIKISELLDKDTHHVFVSLWRKLTDDYPSFQEAEQRALDNKVRHNEVKVDVKNLLMEKPSLTLLKRINDSPLAILEAMDEFLSDRHGAKEDAPSVLVKIKGKTYIIHRRICRDHHKIRHVHQTGHIRTYLRHHWIIPESINGIKISVIKIPVVHSRNNLADRKTIKVFIGNFMDGVSPLWDNGHLPNYRAEILTDKEERWKGVEDLLHKAVRDNADILVLPELTVCQELREKVSLWLDENTHPFSLALPGTFHQRLNGKYYNFGELFDMRGKSVLSHRKLTTFGETGKREKIATGDTIHLLDTPIGLIAMPICFDFCEESNPFAELWQKIGADWHLVPAYGNEKSIRAHNRRATVLNRAHGALTVLSNQADTWDGDSSKLHGFAHCSGQTTDATPENRCISVDLE